MTNYREKILIMIEEGQITADMAVEMMVRWMSSEDIGWMLDAHALLDEEEEE